MLKLPKTIAITGLSIVIALIALPVFALTYLSTVVVTATNPSGWSVAAQLPGGTYDVVNTADAPAGKGVVQLKTDSTSNALISYRYDIAQMMGTPLSTLPDIGFSSRTTAGTSSLVAKLTVGLDMGVYADLVYNPADQAAYGGQAFTPNSWQQWDLSNGYYQVVPRGSTTKLDQNARYTMRQILEAYPQANVYTFEFALGPDQANTTAQFDRVIMRQVLYDFEVDPSVIVEPEVDKTAPVATITSPAQLSVAKGPLTVVGTITDETELGVYSISIRDASDQVVASSGVLQTNHLKSEDVSFTFDSSKIPDGNYTTQIEVIDAAGNQDPDISIATLSFAVDNVPDNKDLCKDGGWETLTINQKFFKNQGQCVSYFTSNAARHN